MSREDQSGSTSGINAREAAAKFVLAAYQRAERARGEAHALHEAGFHSAAVVWAVRATEILMRDFLLAPYFYEQGESLSDALDRGSRVLGSNRWRRAFRRVEEWYGPFDAPLTETGEDAWKVWLDVCVERRHGLVHGNAVEEATGEEAAEVLGYADRIATWYAQLLFVSGKHPMARELWQLLADAAKAFREISDSAARDLGSRDEEQP